MTLVVGSLETELWLQVQTIQCIRQRSLPFFPAQSVPSTRSKSKVWQRSPSEELCEKVAYSSAAQIIPFSPSNNSLFICLCIALLPCTEAYICPFYKILCIMSDLRLTYKDYCTNFSLPFLTVSVNALGFFRIGLCLSTVLLLLSVFSLILFIQTWMAAVVITTFVISTALFF